MCTLIVVAASIGCGSNSTSPTAAVSPLSSTATSTPTVTTSQCSTDAYAHVYSPDRLQLLAACIKLTGTIDSETPQADGDYHVRLRIDPGQTCAGQPCLDPKNLSDQAGDLILEPVCENPISQADAVAACQGYHNPLVLPAVGSHVLVMGPFVLDSDHGWNEIHPLESITVMPGSTPSPAPSIAPPPATLTVSITVSTYGSLAATTLPGASCTAKAKLPSGRISTAAGLQASVVAGDDGGVSWSYGTSSTTKAGMGTHTVTCTLGGKTVSASAAFVVT